MNELTTRNLQYLPNGILIHGRAFSGKDTVADYLVSEYNYHKITFAEPIYSIAKKVFRMKRKNRKLLQFIGQGARKIYPNIWVNIAFKRAEKLIAQGKRVVISDMRQANEYEAGDKRKYLSIHVFAQMTVRMKRCKERDGIEPEPELWEKASETGADKYIDYMHWIDNSFDIDATHGAVDLLLAVYDDRERRMKEGR